MKYHVDECLSPDIASYGRRAGLDVTDWCSQSLQGASDRAHLAFAAAEGRCVITKNCRDFRRLTREAQQRKARHAGILCVPERWAWDIDRVIEQLVWLAAEYPRATPPYTVRRLTAED